VTALDPRPTIPASSWADRLAALVETTGGPARLPTSRPEPWLVTPTCGRTRSTPPDTSPTKHAASCASDSDRAQPCDSPSSPAVLADLWAGKARMAAACAAAGLPVDDLDRQALDHGANT
jgi:hypothetical protein